MQIITSDIQDRISRIAQMEATQAEIEQEIIKLCFDVADKVIGKKYEFNMDTLSFEHLSREVFGIAERIPLKEQSGSEIL